MSTKTRIRKKHSIMKSIIATQETKIRSSLSTPAKIMKIQVNTKSVLKTSKIITPVPMSNSILKNISVKSGYNRIYKIRLSQHSSWISLNSPVLSNAACQLQSSMQENPVKILLKYKREYKK